MECKRWNEDPTERRDEQMNPHGTGWTGDEPERWKKTKDKQQNG
jgi:hypothetical protein